MPTRLDRARVGHMLVLAALLTACGRQTVETPPSSAPPSSTASVVQETPAPEPSATGADDALSDRVVATLPIGGGPDMPTDAFGSIWVLALDGPIMNDGTVPAVHRIDPATNEVVASVELPARACQGIGASPEAVWVCAPDGVARIDPTTNAIVATVPVDVPLIVSRLAYGAGSVWAFATSGVVADSVVRIDPATNQVTATIPLGHTAGTMAFGADALWVTSPADDLVLRVDPATGSVEEWATDVDGAYWLAVTDSAVWVSLFGEEGVQVAEDEPTLARIDPTTRDVVASIATGGSVEISGGISATDDAVWVRAPQPFLVRVDPSTNGVVETLPGSSGGGDVVAAFGSVWATVESGEVLRIAP